MKKKVYNAAIVGCGRIASLFDNDPKRKFVASHAGAYTANRSTKLVAAADIDEKRLDDFGKRWGVTSLYQDYKQLFKSEKIDIVSVCTWTKLHYEVVKAAVESGVKAVFCEKPIADNLLNADKMIRLCKKNKVILVVNHRRRWDRLHHEIKKYITEEKLGQIQCVSAYYSGGIANTATHLFDILRFFFGDALWVWADLKQPGVKKDPDIDGSIRFKDGFNCSVQSFDAKEYIIFEIDIYGTKGRLRIKDVGMRTSFWKVENSPDFSESKVLIESTSGFTEKTLNMVMQNSVEDIINCLNTGKFPFSTGEDGSSALELICAFHSSVKLNKKVFLPLKDRTIESI